MARPPHVRQLGSELEAFFDLSVDPLSIIGFDGELKRVNAASVRLSGYPELELYSRSAFDVLHPDDVQPAREAPAQLACGHDMAAFEARVICADGSARWLEWSTRSVPDGASSTASGGTQPSAGASRSSAASRAEHDQAARVVTGRTEQQPGNPAPAVTVDGAGHDHHAPHVRGVEHADEPVHRS